MDLNDALINRNNAEAREDNFYVQFYGLPEDIGNVLGRQIREMTRPEFTFNMNQTRHRGAVYTDHANLTFSTVTLTFADDENGLTSMYLYAQLLRQRNSYQGELDHIFDGYADKRFGMQVQMFNSRDEPTEGYLLQGCLLGSIRHSDKMYAGDGANKITVTVEYDNVGIQIIDRLIELKREN